MKKFLLSLLFFFLLIGQLFAENWYVSSTKWTAVTAWASATSYSVGDLRRQLATPAIGSERVFRCTTAGTSGGSEPTWTLTEGGTTNDNGAVWTEVTGQETYGWGASHARLSTLLGFSAAGDTYWIGDDHVETAAAPMTITNPGTAASPCRALCVDDSAAPPTTLATTASIYTTGSAPIALDGFIYYYGINFSVGTGSSAASFNMISGSPHWLVFDNCTFALGTTASSSCIYIGLNTTSGDDNRVDLINTSISFGATAQGIETRALFNMRGGAITGATIPTSLFLPLAPCRGIVRLTGVDLSLLGSTKNLVAVSASPIEFYFSNCLLGSSVSAITGTIAGQGGTKVFLDACDSGDPSSGPRSEAYTYQGSVKTDTAVYRSSGASDGTAYSLKMVTNSSGVSFISPLVTRPIFKATGTVGSAMTVTAEIVQADGSTALDEGECWMEVEYMGTSGSTKTSFLNDHNSTLLSASTTDQTTSSVTWTGLTGTPVKQKLAVTFTPQEKGYYMVRIYLARASATVYVCPKLVVS